MDDVLDAAIADIHPFYANVMCLDFANSLEPRGGPPPIDVPPNVEIRDDLMSYPHLVAWTHLASGYDREVALAILGKSDGDQKHASRILAEAHTLRDVLYRVFWSVAVEQQPASADLDAVRTAYASAVGGASLVFSESWLLEDSAIDLARPLWPIARSAMELLTHGRVDRIKVCPGKGRPPVHCAWLFLDTTKNGSRRWCSMSDCGAAEKALHQTARRRKKAALLKA